MKLARTFLLAAGLVALSACGGAEEANVAADNLSDLSDDTYNVAPDDLGADNLDLGNDLLGNETPADDGTSQPVDELPGNATGNGN